MEWIASFVGAVIGAVVPQLLTIRQARRDRWIELKRERYFALMIAVSDAVATTGQIHPGSDDFRRKLLELQVVCSPKVEAEVRRICYAVHDGAPGVDYAPLLNLMRDDLRELLECGPIKGDLINLRYDKDTRRASDASQGGPG